MTPLHPRFREMLLKNPQNRKRGLTPAILHEYESLLNCYFVASAYFHERVSDNYEGDRCSYGLTAEIIEEIEENRKIPVEVIKLVKVLVGHHFNNRDHFLAAVRQLLESEDFRKYSYSIADYAKRQNCYINQTALARLKRAGFSENLQKAIEALTGNLFSNPEHLRRELRKKTNEDISSADLDKILQVVNDITCYPEIVRIRENYIPAYDVVRSQWVTLQKENMRRSEYEGGFLWPIGKSFILLWRLLLGRSKRVNINAN